MLGLFACDVLGLLARLFRIPRIRHFDFKTPIVSIGLFGTFFGVLVGLYGFETKDITGSVPRLLEGLKFAFAISVLGMFLSLTLSILDKFTGGVEDDNEVLKSIDQKMGGLVTSIQSPAELIKQFTEMKTFLKSELKQVNSSLDKALIQLARGATEEVTKALEKIISEFNQNLTQQFGDNFKQLNAACLKLVEWQDKYRTHIDATEGRLAKLIASIDESREALTELAKRNEDTAEVCRQVAGLINTYDLQVKTLEKHLESCKALGKQAGDFLTSTERALGMSTKNLGQFSEAIEQSVSKQSETLARLTQDLDEQLPKTLGELEKVLTNITNQFAADYRSLFQFITDKR